jgi:hypothetical protein
VVPRDRGRREPAGQKGGSLTGPNPVDRGKPGSKIHVLTDRNGLPLSLAVSAENLHDSQAFEPLLQGIPKVRSRRGPRRRKPAKVHADKAYDIPANHRLLRERHIGDRIARIGIESSKRLGRPLGRRAHHRLAQRLPPLDHAIRAPRPPVRRLPRPRSNHHLLQETRQLRHALRNIWAQLLLTSNLRMLSPAQQEVLRKRVMADKIITAKTELIAEVRSVLRSLQQLPAQVTGFFGAPHTNYTLKPLRS